MSSRSLARTHAVQILYQIEFSGYTPQRAMDLFYREGGAILTTREFSCELVEGVLKHQANLDMEIRDYLRGWSLERIARLDHLVLRLAFYELMYDASQPWRVVLDEAVTLAKSFSGLTSASFVNGVLHAWCEANPRDDT